MNMTRDEAKESAKMSNDRPQPIDACIFCKKVAEGDQKDQFNPNSIMLCSFVEPKETPEGDIVIKLTAKLCLNCRIVHWAFDEN